jgi:hypothetical protein
MGMTRPPVSHAPGVASGAAHEGSLPSTAIRSVGPSRRVEIPSSGASEDAVFRPGNLLALQRAAGNVAVGRLLQRRVGVSLIQRAGSPGGPVELHYKGTLLTGDRVLLRTTLQGIIATRGQDEAETFAYGFLRMPPEEKAAMQLVGVSLEQITQIQQTFEPMLHELQDEHKKFINEFGRQVLNDTNTVLDKSKEILHQEEIKYTDTFPARQQTPDLDGLRAAAKALAQKRKAADAAAKTAKAANRAMVDEGRPKAEFGSPFPAMPCLTIQNSSAGL